MPHPPLNLVCVPQAPRDLDSLDIPWALVVDLVARRLHLEGVSTLLSLHRELKLPPPVLEAVFRHLQQEKLVEIRGTDGQNFMLSLTSAGHKFATDRQSASHYAGPAPVSLQVYQSTVRAQSARPKITRPHLRRVFSDLVLEDEVLDQLGPALISQETLFLFGSTGNGKTSLAERTVKVFEDAIVIPYAVEIDGQIISVFDPVMHHPLEGFCPGLDPRWVACQRPAVMVGGELSMEMLELRLDPATNIYAAPVQMKANNGILIVDDFGRQVVSPASLLNRWILPMDRRVDYLNLSYGLKFQVPFELMIVFATNLEPKQLMDAAFLRRIPNKIFVPPVAERSFVEIFRREAARQGFETDPSLCDQLMGLCRMLGGSELRACYPRDICKIVACINSYEESPRRLSAPDLERAVRMYFAENAHSPAAPNSAAQNPGALKRTAAPLHPTSIGNLALAVRN
ncbi:MAG: AAA family ATPase [Bryobacteraceae bacterium]